MRDGAARSTSRLEALRGRTRSGRSRRSPRRGGLLQRALDAGRSDDPDAAGGDFDARAGARASRRARAGRSPPAPSDRGGARGRRPERSRTARASPPTRSGRASTPTRASRTSSPRPSRSRSRRGLGRSRGPRARRTPRSVRAGSSSVVPGEGERDLERAVEHARRTGDGALLRDTMGARLRPAAWGPMHARDGIALCDSLLDAEYANAALDRSRAPGPRAVPGDAGRRRGLSQLELRGLGANRGVRPHAAQGHLRDRHRVRRGAGRRPRPGRARAPPRPRAPRRDR